MQVSSTENGGFFFFFWGGGGGGGGGRGSHCDIRIRVNCTLLGVGILSLSRLIETSSEHDIKKNNYNLRRIKH
jgi:hypothetical protein